MIIISKLKHITIRLVACILVISIALQFVVMPMSAYGDVVYECTSNVTLPPLRDKDWTNAEKIIKPNGNLYWGYFHDQVRDRIAKKYHLIPEFPITYQDWQKKDKEKGFADLCLPTEKYAYLWEIKPVHYGLNPVLEQEALKEQLGGYVDSNSTYRYGHESGLTIQKETFISLEGKFTITYEDALNGLILYRYDPVPQKESEKDEVPQENEQEQKQKDDDKEKDEDKTGQASGQGLPVYVWSNGAIVLRATGEVIINRLYIWAILMLAQGLQMKCNEQGNQNLYHGGGVVSPYKCVAAAAGSTAKALSPAYIGNGLSAESAMNAIRNMRETVMFFSETLAVVLGKTITDRSHCQSEWYDPKCWIDCECDRDHSDPNQKTGDDAEDAFNSAGDAPAPRDPLVIDLNSIGILLTSVDNGVYFDLDNNGFAEKTAWVGPEDGFLVLDRNGNGTIDNGGELFGDQVQLVNGSKSSSGFEALSELDSNGDGFIDSDDASFADLNVWVDKNQNGISEPNELFSLIELRISSISLNYREVGGVDDETGTIVSLESEVTFDDGTARIISEHWFKVNSRDSQDLHDYGEGVVVTSVESFGNIMSLNNAILSDKTGELDNMVDEFKSSMDYAEKRVLIKRILYFITGASDISPNSRGGNIDARVCGRHGS